MTAPDKPTPGQIGLVDGDKLIEKLTIESALTRETPEGKVWIEAMNAVKYWTRLGDFSVTRQGQEEREEIKLYPVIKALLGEVSEAWLINGEETGKCLFCGWHHLGTEEHDEECPGAKLAEFYKAIASADKAQDGKGDGK